MRLKLGLFLCLALGSFDLSICGPDCSINGTYQRCPGSCPDTCKAKDQPCNHDCGGPCVCNKGYVIDNSIPACVLLSDCPAGVEQKEGEIDEVINFPRFAKSYEFYS